MDWACAKGVGVALEVQAWQTPLLLKTSDSSEFVTLKGQKEGEFESHFFKTSTPV
jgi:hypothetical protein